MVKTDDIPNVYASLFDQDDSTKFTRQPNPEIQPDSQRKSFLSQKGSGGHRMNVYSKKGVGCGSQLPQGNGVSAGTAGEFRSPSQTAI